MPSNESDFKSEFPAAITIPVQWGDQDGFGHVNNIVYLRWFESARIEYLSQCGVEISAHGTGPILAAVNCDYRAQLRFPDSVVIGARLAKLGNSSLTLFHQVFSVAQRTVVAEGNSVIVLFDYQAQTSVRIPDAIRNKLNQFEESAG